MKEKSKGPCSDALNSFATRVPMRRNIHYRTSSALGLISTSQLLCTLRESVIQHDALLELVGLTCVGFTGDD